MDVPEGYKLLLDRFDRYGKNWDCCGVLFFQEEYQELLKTANISPGSKVLDLGCGTGGLTVTASQKLGPTVSLTGVDILPGWLNIAKEKAKTSHSGNMDFRLMNIESLQFPDESFHHVISNFVLCCSFQYDRVVKEAYRVLREGGRFTYNHPGPHDDLLLTIFDKIFAKYAAKEPSESLRRFREADELQRNLYSRYRDPFTALNMMRTIGFRNLEAKVVYHPHSFPNVDSWVDWWFYLGKEDPEFVEMGPENSGALIKDLRGAFEPFWTHDGYESEFETLYITGIK